jgi:hypothetical protein
MRGSSNIRAIIILFLSNREKQTVNLDEIFAELDVEYNVNEYMVIRKEFLNFLGT